MIKPKLITAPASAPVTLEDVKKHLRVFYTDDDDYIEGLLQAAIAHLDGYQGILNRCLVSQTWQTAHCHFCHRMETLFTDTTAVAVKYYDADGDLQTIDNAANVAYLVYPDYIHFKSDFVFPVTDRRDDAVLIESTHGYAEIPQNLILAIKILVAHWYRNRVPVSFGNAPANIPFTVDALIAPHRWAF